MLADPTDELGMYALSGHVVTPNASAPTATYVFTPQQPGGEQPTSLLHVGDFIGAATSRRPVAFANGRPVFAEAFSAAEIVAQSEVRTKVVLK